MGKRLRFFFLSIIVFPLFFYSQSFARDYVPLSEFCLTNSVTAKANLALGYISLEKDNKSAKIHLLMPYITSGEDIYFMQSGVRFNEKGGVDIPREYISALERLLGIREDKDISALDGILRQIGERIAKAREVEAPSVEEKQREILTHLKDDKSSQTVYNKDGFKPIDAIIIDAGHGGHDPGAIRTDGTKEKDIVLDIARQLADFIRADGKYKVFLTRNGDYFVTLEQRVEVTAELARKHNPVFISIHANSNPFEWAEGIEVFSLGDEPSDDTAMNVVRLENAGFSPKDIERTESIYSILLDLVKDALQVQSDELSKTLLSAMIRQTGAKNRGAKKAPFYVLKFNTVPSVLVEVGFLSNSREAARLKTRAYREKTARGLFYGINEYIRRYNNTKGFGE
jgi:N-acetylmuramoyl-L-alanine amidase